MSFDSVPVGCANEPPSRVSEHEAVLTFVRTPFAVRCNVVKVWRPLPRGIWNLLDSRADVLRSRRRERHAVLGVVLLATSIVVGFLGTGYEWCHTAGRLLSPVLWVAAPPVAGWAFVRLLWIPRVTADLPTRGAVTVFTRYLSGVYLYVYLMIFVGAALMLILASAAPVRTEVFRDCLWLFLFGESFFVPAVLWVRLVMNDSSGQVFGRSRYAVLMLYLVLFVAFPIIGMGLVFTKRY